MTRGGKRPGAGRPPSAEKMKPRSFKATDADWQQIHELAAKHGFESTSEYIRHVALGKSLRLKS